MLYVMLYAAVSAKLSHHKLRLGYHNLDYGIILYYATIILNDAYIFAYGTISTVTAKSRIMV